jgi:MarR family transcriptional regulator, lower aerobic nicotinate degradation pathway regulator
LDLTIDELWNSPGFLIRRCQQISTAIFLEEAADYDFSPTQYSALAFIHLQPGIDQSTLGDRIALDRSSVTKCVERLEKRAFIRREVDPADRRARRLYSTDDGAVMLKKLAAAAERTRKRVMKPLAADEQGAFLDTLKRLGDALNDQSRAPMQHCQAMLAAQAAAAGNHATSLRQQETAE